jgi:hypothetical protein
MARRRGLLLCLPIGACLLSPSAAGQEGTSDSIRNEGFAESIVAREEAQSGRAFDPAFRAWAKTALGALPAESKCGDA